MEQAEHDNSEKETEATYSLLYTTMAYNRGEITLDEWIAQTKKWAERIIQQHAKPEQS